MADEPLQPNGHAEPPKASPSMGGSRPPTSSRDNPAAGIGIPQPPKIRIKSVAEKKAETTRLNLESAHAPDDTPPADLKEPSKESLEDFYKKSTIRISTTPQGDEPPKAKNETARISPELAKKSTMRVDATPDQTKKSTIRVSAEPADPSQIKKATIRVNVDPNIAKKSTMKVEPETDLAKMTTMRVEVAPAADQTKKKSETTRLELPPDQTKRITSKLSTGDAVTGAGPTDPFKNKTIPVGIPTAPPPTAAKPQTLGVQRPRTIVMKPKGATSPNAITPPQPIENPAATANAVVEAKKSETARIDIPPAGGVDDRPATRPKTIKIKRADPSAVAASGSRKPLVVARPVAHDEPQTHFRPPEETMVDADELPGAVFTVLAIAALLVFCVLIYVLAAQTILPDLSFPGKIV